MWRSLRGVKFTCKGATRKGVWSAPVPIVRIEITNKKPQNTCKVTLNIGPSVVKIYVKIYIREGYVGSLSAEK